MIYILGQVCPQRGLLYVCLLHRRQSGVKSLQGMQTKPKEMDLKLGGVLFSPENGLLLTLPPTTEFPSSNKIALGMSVLSRE